MKQERNRQVQKTLQNCIGEFHQKVLGAIPGWEDMTVGNLIDVRCVQKRIVAELKNKYNTPKGSEKKSIYDNLKSEIEGGHMGFTGYYVEIIPLSTKPYDLPFTPSDNVTHTRRPENPKIRVTDGKSF